MELLGSDFDRIRPTNLRVPVVEFAALILFHHAADVDEESLASQYVRQSRMWFDSIWNSVARDLPR